MVAQLASTWVEFISRFQEQDWRRELPGRIYVGRGEQDGGVPGNFKHAAYDT
jgi:hypothetical protein